LEKALKAKVLVPGGMQEAFWYDLPATGPEGPSNGIAVGDLVQVPLMSKTVAGVVVETGSPDLDFKTKAIRGSSPLGRVSRAWIEMLQWIGAYYFTPLPQVFATGFPKAALDHLFPKVSQRKAKDPVPASGPETGRAPGAGRPELKPNPEQAAAIAAVSECMRAPDGSGSSHYQTFLLHGVTGSGKTLVYLHLARQALAAGRRVLVLLPEIALTPQALDSFRAFLGRPVFAFHSNLSAKDRRSLWQAVFSGRADIVVGARSAALCPMDDLGLIVVDEEHDGSYKQSDAAPRYSARDVALYRGRQAGCPVVLGSATPSLESYFAARAGKQRLLELRDRATGSVPPKVVLVDMREQLEMQGGLPLSIPLREALQGALAKRGQAILFLNRRGYAPRRICRTCGEARQCPHCAVPLVYHKGRGAVRCHYCDYSLPADSACRKCGGLKWQDLGRGVEKIEEYLNEIFPKAGVARLDRDTTSTIGGAEKILGAFRRGELQILLGTQMVAKGHDFPGVNLVGVIDADAGLGLADFRAQERAFQLITQVAGRAGRHTGAGAEPGMVYLQTFKPENPLLGFALTHDYASFYQAEIERRRELEYPPFRRLLLAEITGEDEATVEAHMRDFAEPFHRFAGQAEVIVLGPAFAAMKKIKDQYRAQIIGKGKAPNQLQWVVRQTLHLYKPEERKKTKLRIDMDPLSML
jgi:primosomal protein N' (replication factor Y)